MENETLDRIQREIQEALEREAELRNKYAQINAPNNSNNNNNVEVQQNGVNPLVTSPSPEPVPAPRLNGEVPKGRMFTANSNAKGVMHKFLKMRGKLNVVTMRPNLQPQSSWTPEETFTPAKVTPTGRPIRNGFVSAEEKMRKELLEFQRREEELRLERRKSQPDLMAALEREKEEEARGLKGAKSMTSVYSCEDLSENGYGNGGLKPARSLVDLNGEEEEPKKAHTLIRQFERMQSHS